MFGAFIRKTRAYKIPFDSIPKDMKIRTFGHDPSHDFSMNCELFEDKEGFSYEMKFNDKEAAEFENLAKQEHETKNVPLYTFRCHKCKTVFPLSLIGGSLLFKNKDNKLDIELICKVCRQI